MDAGQKQTDKLLKDLGKELDKIYAQALKEVQAKLDDYMRRFKIKDEIKRKALKQGKITEAEYKQWRLGQIMIGKRWEEMQTVLATDLTNANRVAASIINDHTPEAYAIGRNYGAYQVDLLSKGAGLSFTLYDRHTVERLIKDQPDLLPKSKVDIPKDLRWNKQNLRSAVLQSILQGEDLGKTASRLQRAGMKSNLTKQDVLSMKKYQHLSSAEDIAKVIVRKDREIAIRNARTMMTSAENGGRLDSYEWAQDMGIPMEKQWLATLDGRTRHSHAAQDGEHVPIKEKFSNGLMFPADPDGNPREVYNCRCTMVAVPAGTNPTVNPNDVYRNSRLGDEDYEEWLGNHREFKIKVPTLQAQIGKATSVEQINTIMNSQGWFRKRQFGIQTTVDLKGCDLESAKSIAASYQQVFERYPKLKGKIDAPNARPIGMGDNTYAWCYIKSGGMVQVNPKMYNNWTALEASYDRDVLTNWHPRGTTAEGIVVHELGHAIDGLLAREGVLGGVSSSGEYRYASSSLRNTIMKRVAKNNPGSMTAHYMDRNMWDAKEGMTYAVSNGVSRYATKNPQEWFAECFVEYITSANPRMIASEFGKELERLIGKLK